MSDSPLDSRLAAFLDVVPDAMVIVGPDGRIRLANHQAEQLFGYTHEELIGAPIELLVPARYRDAHRGHRGGFIAHPRTRAMGSGLELFGRRQDGSEFPVEISLSAFAGDDGPLVSSAIRDVTERNRLQEESRAARRAIEITDELRAALREREVLLQEVHHRVKNNLQVIASLINMQVRQLADPASKRALVDCRTRVLAIGLIHETLYQYKNYAHLPFSDYARRLTQHIVQAVSPGPRVGLDLQLEPLSLAVDKAIPLGLILNELVTNAYTHAFPAGRGGTIRVELRQTDPAQVVMVVADDGVGGAAAGERPADRAPALGLQLVHTLVEQLSGRLVMGRDGGFSYTLHVPLEVPDGD